MAHLIDGPNQDFALRVVDSRRNAKMTQDYLANKLGIDVRNISMYENGRQFPREGMVAKLAKVLNVDTVWLATGNSQETLNYLDEEYAKRPKTPTEVALLYIKEWDKISRGPVMVYNAQPRYGSELADLGAFVPYAKNVCGRYAAVRYPGMKPSNVAYPAGCIVIYEEGPHMINRVPSGSDVIFRHRGAENEAGLRRLIREPGIPTAMLVPLDPTAPFEPLRLDPLNVDVEIIGIVIQRVIDHRMSPA